MGCWAVDFWGMACRTGLLARFWDFRGWAMGDVVRGLSFYRKDSREANGVTSEHWRYG